MTVTPDSVTVTEIPEPVTQIVTATVTATAAPTSTAPATSAAATTATTTPTAWPDASSTGVPAGTTLVASAMCSITVDGTVIDSRELNCPDGVSVAAKDVTIMNSKVNGHIYMDNDRSSDYSLTVIDSEVDGGDYIWPTIATGNTKIYRSNLHGGQNGLTRDDGSAFCEMYGSYVPGQNQQPDVDAHLGGFLSLGAQATCTGTDGNCIVLKNNYNVCDAP